jgi:putative endonuclease
MHWRRYWGRRAHHRSLPVKCDTIITMEKRPCVYILASKSNGTLYVGVTSDLPKRIWEHRQGVADGFTKKHGVKTLVYYEMHETMLAAITREKQIKNWKRDWKINCIIKNNPDWLDLYDEICS